MNVLVTGATGFVGAALVRRLLSDGDHRIRAAVRSDGASLPTGVEAITVGDIGPTTRWQHAVTGVDTVIHLAARVHVMRDDAVDPLAQFRRVNVDGTLRLARAAAAAGVSRLIFLSSVKVNGEGRLGSSADSSRTGGRHGSYSETDAPAPRDAYGMSKWEAETGLRAIAAETGIAIVILRPPLIYGPGVKANFLNMMQWLCRRVPLPLGAVHNKRSLVALDNLVDLITVCVNHDAAANETFLVSDGEDLSTTELLVRLSAALGVRPRLIPVPAHILMPAAVLLGMRALAERLLGTLRVDSTRVREVLGWRPPVPIDDALKRTADAYIAKRGRPC